MLTGGFGQIIALSFSSVLYPSGPRTLPPRRVEEDGHPFLKGRSLRSQVRPLKHSRSLRVLSLAAVASPPMLHCRPDMVTADQERVTPMPSFLSSYDETGPFSTSVLPEYAKAVSTGTFPKPPPLRLMIVANRPIFMNG